MALMEIVQEFKSRLTNNHGIVKSVIALFGGNAAYTLLQSLGGLLIVRFAGPEEIGLLAACSIPLGYLAFLHIGTFDGLQRQIPFYVGKHTPERAQALASSAGAWNSWVSSIVCLGFSIVAFHDLLGKNYFGFAGWMTQAASSWRVFYGEYLGATYRTINQFVRIARVQFIQAILSFGLVFTLPFWGFYGLCARQSSANLLVVLLYHRFRPYKMPYRINMKDLKEVVRIGVPFSFWGILNTSVWATTESSLMLVAGGISGLGLFAGAVFMRGAMQIIPDSLQQVLKPRMVEAIAREGSVEQYIR